MRNAGRNALLLSLAAVAGACGSDPYVGETVASSQSDAALLTQTDAAGVDLRGSGDAGDDSTLSTGIYQIAIAGPRLLDLVFMIDNSPSMAPKQQKLLTQFPRLIEALKDPTDGSLPDLRVAIVDSDLGTGGGYSSGSCGPKTLADGTMSNYGDLGRFQMISATSCGVTSADSLFLEYKAGAPVNFVGDISTVFACLASNLGTIGCGEEHSLQAFEFALAAKGIGNEAQQAAFLRPNAYLGLIFLTDEDDCSAATNDGMFGIRPGNTDLSGESASLRCYTRSHQCSGANLSVTGPGYPTKQAFSALLSQCSARTDACPNPTDGVSSTGTDTSNPTSCSPLKDIKQLANHLKSVKSSSDQIFVAGIFGWPITDSDLATAVYKIDSVPNPTADPVHSTVWDSWPICYDPNHKPSTSAFDTAASGWGGNGRSSQFRIPGRVRYQRYEVQRLRRGLRKLHVRHRRCLAEEGPELVYSRHSCGCRSRNAGAAARLSCGPENAGRRSLRSQHDHLSRLGGSSHVPDRSKQRLGHNRLLAACEREYTVPCGSATGSAATSFERYRLGLSDCGNEAGHAVQALPDLRSRNALELRSRVVLFRRLVVRLLAACRTVARARGARGRVGRTVGRRTTAAS